MVVNGSVSPEEGEFPWHLGVHDAHCHPTDIMATIHDVPLMKTQGLTVMATRRQDQHLVARFADELQQEQGQPQRKEIIPSFGFHPWFSHQLIEDRGFPVGERPSKADHYRQVIKPVPENDQDFLNSLPEPLLLSEVLQAIESHLLQYPDALVGEIGLDKAFRIPGAQLLDDPSDLDAGLTPGRREGRKLSPYRVNPHHQQKILLSQLRLAAKLQRPVSVHGVAAHGLLYETIASTWRSQQIIGDTENTISEEGKAELRYEHKPHPPRICLHSYSGHVDTMKQYLQPSVPAKVFFSFCTLVNFSPESARAVDVIKAVPPDRVLAESDLHAAGDEMDKLMEDIVRKICRIKGWSLTFGVERIGKNWRHFVFGSADAKRVRIESEEDESE